jgi:hypothetical protein
VLASPSHSLPSLLSLSVSLSDSVSLALCVCPPLPLSSPPPLGLSPSPSPSPAGFSGNPKRTGRCISFTTTGHTACMPSQRTAKPGARAQRIRTPSSSVWMSLTARGLSYHGGSAQSCSSTPAVGRGGCTTALTHMALRCRRHHQHHHRRRCRRRRRC